MIDANLLHTTALASFRTIRPTPSERVAGRLMRGPDHDAGSEGGDAGSDSGTSADGGGSADAGAQGGQDASGSGGEAGQGSDGEDSSLLGDAGAGAGEGSDGEGGDKDGASGEGDKVAADGPPEAYELKVTVQDGEGKDVEVPIDQELLAEATPTLKELNLTNEQANKLAPMVLKVQERVIQAQADNYTVMKAAWAQDVQKDPELGGAKWAETEALAAKALDAFGAPSEKDKDGNETNPFRQLLNETGLGNHPEMIRMFRKIGEKLGEGDFVRGDATVKKPVDKTREQYPNDPPKAAVKE